MTIVAEAASGARDQVPAVMSAMRVHTYGGPDVIVTDSIPVPRPGNGEILVAVHAAGVGPWDGWIRAGKSVLPQPLPLTLGSDVSGVVVEVGASVNAFFVGQRVYGVTNKRFTDGYAEFAVCAAAMMAPKPESLSDLDAASVPVIAATAWQILFDHAGLQRGQSVFVQGAPGNVGRYAVQLAVQAGIRVIASASPKDETTMRALGAAAVVGRNLVTNDRVDAVIDLVGGPSQAELFRLIRPGGSLISAVAEPDRARAHQAGVRSAFVLVDVTTAVLRELTARFDAGVLQTAVGTVLPLSEAARAHAMLEGVTAHSPGKIVLSVG